MRSRFSLARAGAAVVGASATALMLTALPAHADEVSGTVSRGDSGHQVNLNGGRSLSTSLMNLSLDGDGSLRVYCVEIDENVDYDRSMIEQPWDAYPNPESPFHEAKNRHKINWILHNAYPAVDTDTLGEAVLADGAKLNDGLNKPEAIAATQAAIWHFSDDEDLKQDNPTSSGEKSDHDVWAAYQYLTGDANIGIAKQPAPALRIDPAEAKGVAGEPIGPITVTSNGTVSVKVQGFPEGAEVLDAEGNQLSEEEVLNGEEFFIKLPADADAGQGSFTLTASTKVATGRLFVAEGYAEDHAQSLIVASSDKTTLSDTGKVSWTAAPIETTPPSESTPPEESAGPPSTGASGGVAAPSTTETSVAAQPDTENLAYTGASVLTPVLIGVGLLGVGALALLLVRRRKQV